MFLLRLLHRGDERPSLLDDIGREFACRAASDILRRVDHSGRNEQHAAGFENDRWPALDLILQRALKNVDDLLTRVKVALGDRASRPTYVAARAEYERRLGRAS